ncbi:methionyl-tRNA synthetase [Parcubacteria bacterium DG_74_2]|nr:MAG: methionyl-tRNA synthetase [Parcubacteria bacterium DG_74_2]
MNSNKNKKFYITSSIAYTNAPPHIGFALEVIQADVLARYHRLLGEDVFFLTGTDEHGIKNFRAAKRAQKAPQEFINEIAAKFKELTKILNISNNDFIRTTDQKKHWPGVRKAWLMLKNKGDIYKKKYKGFYCVGCEAFITKKDLVGGKCSIHQKKPELIEEENYFFKLSKYSKKIEKVIKKDELKIIPNSRKNEVLSFIKTGIKDISFSRPKKHLKWGIPVPDDETQLIYVWSDALVNYISALGYAQNSSKFERFWPADIHCVGKDIIRFHAVIWPGILFSLGLTLPRIILVHGFITSSGQKMSKSLGNVVDPFELVEKYSTDAVRYFLLREIPPTKDGDFTEEKFETRYNSDLAAGIGNLVSRVVTMAAKSNPKPQIPNFKQTSNPKFQTKIDKIRKNYKQSLENFKFNEALIFIWELISFCDKYIEKERPWENKENQKQVISDLLLTIKEIAKLLEPFLPETSEKISKQLDELQTGKPLFPRI